jgi:hypothetical protein
MFNEKQHYENSSLRENIIEHMFVGLSLGELWRKGIVNVEILRSEFDAYGYDLVISSGDLVRHVQLKSGTSLKKISVSKRLAEKPSGCVLFIVVNDDLDLGPFWFFGSDPGEPLPVIEDFATTKRATHNSQRQKPDRAMHRTVPKGKFKKLNNLSEVLSQLLNKTTEMACQ